MPGSEAGFEHIWREHRAGLWRVAWLIGGDADAADDIVSAAFTRAFQGWGDRAIDDPRAYLRRAVVNESTDWFRRRGRDRRWLVRRHGEGRAVRPMEDQVADGTDLAAALGRLSVEHRTIVILRYWEDLSERAAAELLSISVGTVKSRTSRALQALAADLGPGFGPEPAVEVHDG